MRCKICDYRLWNLKGRQCPECGTTFYPSDYEFKINTVRFCCPHCDQSYYGTDARGHLVPRQFNCVHCGQSIDMDEMVLRPADNIDEEYTAVEQNPWLNRRKKGAFKSWFKTIVMAMASPGRLMQITPYNSSLSQALWFACLSQLVYMFVAALPMTICMFVIIPMSGFAGLGVGLFLPVVAIFLFLVNLFIWSLITHGVLLISRRPPAAIRETHIAFCYSSGANALLAVPCIGWYFGWLAWIWWMVSAIIMIHRRHQVSGLKASLAVLTWPVSLITLAISLFAAMSALLPHHVSFNQAGIKSRMLGQSLISYAVSHGNQGPKHAIELVSTPAGPSSGPQSMSHVFMFLSPSTMTRLQDVPIGQINLLQYENADPSTQQASQTAAIAALPANIIAHRLGDYIFTYHRINFSNADPKLWIAVMYPDPDVNPVPGPFDDVVLIHADGHIETITIRNMANELTNQNYIRAGAGLPPLPDPATITHARPAVHD